MVIVLFFCMKCFGQNLKITKSSSTYHGLNLGNESCSFFKSTSSLYTNRLVRKKLKKYGLSIAVISALNLNFVR